MVLKMARIGRIFSCVTREPKRVAHLWSNNLIHSVACGCRQTGNYCIYISTPTISVSPWRQRLNFDEWSGLGLKQFWFNLVARTSWIENIGRISTTIARRRFIRFVTFNYLQNVLFLCFYHRSTLMLSSPWNYIHPTPKI